MIAAETEKLLRNLPEGCTEVRVEDVEKNVGISRQYSIFELTRELSLKNAAKALSMLPQLKNCEAHSTVILPAVDDNTFRRLGVNLTCDPSYQSHKLYHK